VGHTRATRGPHLEREFLVALFPRIIGPRLDDLLSPPTRFAKWIDEEDGILGEQPRNPARIVALPCVKVAAEPLLEIFSG
jgi:hypothetical protein